MNDYPKLVAKALATVGEIMPWDLAAEIAKNPALILLDIRHPLRGQRTKTNARTRKGPRKPIRR